MADLNWADIGKSAADFGLGLLQSFTESGKPPLMGGGVGQVQTPAQQSTGTAAAGGGGLLLALGAFLLLK